MVGSDQVIHELKRQLSEKSAEILRLRGLLEEAEDCPLSFGAEDPELLSRIRQALRLLEGGEG